MEKIRWTLEELAKTTLWEELSEDEQAVLKLHWNSDAILLPFTANALRRWIERRVDQMRATPIAHVDLIAELVPDGLLGQYFKSPKDLLPFPYHGDQEGDGGSHLDLSYSDDGTEPEYHADMLHLDEGGIPTNPHLDFLHADEDDDLHQDFHFQDGWVEDDEHDDGHADEHDDGGRPHQDHEDNGHSDAYSDGDSFSDAHSDGDGHADGSEHDDTAHSDADHEDGPYADVMGHVDWGHEDLLHYDGAHEDDHGDREHGDQEHADAEGPYSDHSDGGAPGHNDSYADVTGHEDGPYHNDYHFDHHSDSGRTGVDYSPTEAELYSTVMLSLQGVETLLNGVEVKDVEFLSLLQARLEHFFLNLQGMDIPLNHSDGY
ncbi:MAG: hypothetical protein KKC99_13135 [Proteobacteria bacterium]|nr:hypothetical protein [Pseudomonadota bacterium]